MRNAVEKIYRPVERIDDPLIVARLVAHDAFLTVKRVLGKTLEQDFRDQILRQNIDLELDVVRGGGVHRERFLEARAEQFACGQCRLLRHLEKIFHRCTLTDSPFSPASFLRKKNREKKMNSSPGLKLG